MRTKSAINFIIDGWNGLDFTIDGGKLPFPPHTKFPSFTIGVPDIDPLHTGGLFSAPSGQNEGLALLLNGERVLSPTQTSEFDRGNLGGRGDITIQVAGVESESDIITGVRELRRDQMLAAAS